ncbi:MAG: M24 family metallopeptidase, partial [Pseudomonadota bacterium]
LDMNNLLLIDSGGQYRDGTTDITRTLALGQPTDDMVGCFTRVLKGMITLSMLRFPTGLSGRDIDALARAPLWAAGQDFDHGTGHGVGSFLCVHEGPQRISRASTVPLQPGMIVSNEPGYYRAGAFGIRLENLIVVQKAPALAGGDTRDMLHFETLTTVPIDRRLIDHTLMTQPEIDWLNAYHAKIGRDFSGHLTSQKAESWLKQAIAPI